MGGGRFAQCECANRIRTAAGRGEKEGSREGQVGRHRLSYRGFRLAPILGTAKAEHNSGDISSEIAPIRRIL